MRNLRRWEELLKRIDEGGAGGFITRDGRGLTTEDGGAAHSPRESSRGVAGGAEGAVPVAGR